MSISVFVDPQKAAAPEGDTASSPEAAAAGGEGSPDPDDDQAVQVDDVIAAIRQELLSQGEQDCDSEFDDNWILISNESLVMYKVCSMPCLLMPVDEGVKGSINDKGIRSNDATQAYSRLFECR